MKNRWLFLASAGVKNEDELCRWAENMVVVAVDGGVDTARKLHLAADYFIGDLDSADQEPAQTESLLLPKEKDQSDLQVALEYALEHGAEELYLLGCTNGRADHYFANLCLLETLAGSGARAVIADGQNRIFYHAGGKQIFRRSSSGKVWEDGAILVPPLYSYLSILPLNSTLNGVSFSGVKYPLESATLHRGATLSVSNEMIREEAELIAPGGALLILSRDVK